MAQSTTMNTMPSMTRSSLAQLWEPGMLPQPHTSSSLSPVAITRPQDLPAPPTSANQAYLNPLQDTSRNNIYFEGVPSPEHRQSVFGMPHAYHAQNMARYDSPPSHSHINITIPQMMPFLAPQPSTQIIELQVRVNKLEMELQETRCVPLAWRYDHTDTHPWRTLYTVIKWPIYALRSSS